MQARLKTKIAGFGCMPPSPSMAISKGAKRNLRTEPLSRDCGNCSPPNATDPAPEIGHEVKLINFNQVPGSPLALRIENFSDRCAASGPGVAKL